MLYTIKHTCGHEEEVQVYGTNAHGERDSKVAWLESKPCRECELAAKHAEADASSDGMAELDGSEKQVRWAKDIRHEMIAKVEGKLSIEEELMTGNESDENIAEFARRGALVVGAIEGKTSARWFIDNRNLTSKQVIKLVAMDGNLW